MQRGRAIGRRAGVRRGVDDLVPAPVEWRPTIGAGRSEEDDAWRARRGGDVRGAGVVRDQQIEGRDDRGELAEIGHAGQIDRGRVHRAAHRRRKRSLLIRSGQDDPRLKLFRQPVAKSGERLRRPAPAGIGCADVEADHRASIRGTDQRRRLGHVRQVSAETRCANQRARRRPHPQAAATAAAPARSRPSSTPSSGAGLPADRSQRSASPRVPRRTRCSPRPSHASGWRGRTVASAEPSARRRWATPRSLDNRGTAGSDRPSAAARRNPLPRAGR